MELWANRKKIARILRALGEPAFGARLYARTGEKFAWRNHDLPAALRERLAKEARRLPD